MSLVTENTDAIMANSAALDNVEAAQAVLADADKALSEAIASGDATAIAATATAKSTNYKTNKKTKTTHYII